MDGININDVTLFLIRLPGRKGLAFAFLDGSTITPVAYVSTKMEESATQLWEKMIKDLPTEGDQHANR